MTYSIVYSSKTGNTKLLAETIRNTLPTDDRIYFGPLNDLALNADRIYVGFWTNIGSCDAATAQFLHKAEHKEIFLFGTAGFGASEAYFQQVAAKAATEVPATSTVIGSYMCQGQMPPAIRDKYVGMIGNPKAPFDPIKMIENFDMALGHPNVADLDALVEKIKA